MELDRSEYIKKYHQYGEDTMEKEKLPMVSEVLDFAVNGDISKRLQHVFDFFGDEEELENLVTRKRIKFTEEQSQDFIASVIAANITDITQSGSMYKCLMASGDNFRIRGNDCKSSGEEIKLPITEDEFDYRVKDCYFKIEKDDQDYMICYDYDEFNEVLEDLKELGYSCESIFVRSPMTCKHRYKHSCCPICAGELPEGTQNIGAFSTLMITETATQSALSSMNKGRKENINTLLNSKADGISTIEGFNKWANDILDNLQSGKVERRFYEIALLSRLQKKDSKVTVTNLSTPETENYFGNFIYRPNKTNYRALINAGKFNDNSLKTQIAFNNYRKGEF